MVEVIPVEIRSNRMHIRASLALALFFALIVIAFYWQTAWSMVAIWQRMGTYTHGFIVIPIVLWLIWDKRPALATCEPKPVFSVQFFLILGGSLWLVAYISNVVVVQQLAFVCIIILGIWSIIGNEMARVLAFPLGFLFMAVPMGEDLVPPMMEFTATSTVWLIKLTGIPVYREGLYFSLPSGNWSVVQACSGVRYLIASFTLGLLFAHLTYRSRLRQLVFVLASIAVPVLANSLRAFMIVMLGHLSNMELATGVDHLVYGWVFFGFVMLLLFWVGSFWREDSQAPVDTGRDAQVIIRNRTPLAVFPVFFTALVLAALWPLFAKSIENISSNRPLEVISTPSVLADWRVSADVLWDWRLRDRGAENNFVQFYEREGVNVALYLQQYRIKRGGTKLTGGKIDSLMRGSASWRILDTDKVAVQVDGEEIIMRQVRLTDGNRTLLTWYRFRIGSMYTWHRYVAKFYEMLNIAMFEGRDAAVIALCIEQFQGDEGDSRAKADLQAFLIDQSEAIEASLDAAAL